MDPAGCGRQARGRDLVSVGITCWLLLVTGNHAFSVVSTSEQTYKGISFLVIEATVPADFVSASENWCRDYQNLCAQYNKRPTGTGLDGTLGTWDMTFNTASGRCVTEYGSDPYINNALGRSPSNAVKALVVSTFPVQESYAHGRSFGFLYCDNHCHRDLETSAFGLHDTYYAYSSNDHTVFTVCTGKLGNDACKTANGGCADVCIHTQIGTRCLCTQPGFRLMADGRGCEGIHAFDVLRTANQQYREVDFLVIEARLPADGQSDSENCCETDYDSDRYINNAFKCPPNITEVVDLAFSVGAAGKKAFGFNSCGFDPPCHRDINYSPYSLYSQQSKNRNDIVWTVCAGAVGNNPCASGNAGCVHVCVHTQSGYRCICRQGFSLMVDDHGCEECGHCQGGDVNCDTVTGICSAGCQDGWKTQYCKEIVDPPVNLTVTDVTDEGSNVTWSPSPDPDLQGYHVVVSEMDTVTAVNQSTNQTWLQVAGLTRETDYVIRVTVLVLSDGRLSVSNATTVEATTIMSSATDLQFVNVTETTSMLRFTWVPPDAVVIGYRVMYGQGEAIEQLSPSTGPADRSAVIEGLQAGVLFKVEIITIGVRFESLSLVGHNATESDECATVNGWCDQICANVPGSYRCFCRQGFVLMADAHGCGAVDPPINLVISDVTDKGLKITWSPSPDPDLHGYRVAVSQLGMATAVNHYTDQTSFPVLDLSPDSDYVVTVTSLFLTDGWWSQSETVVRHASTDMSSATDLQFTEVTESTLGFTWVPPDAVVTGYRVMYGQGEATEQLSPSPGPVGRSAVIEGLQAGTMYKVEIITIGVRFVSLPLVGHNATEMSSATDLQFVEVTESTLGFTWVPPDAVVTGYRVMYGQGEATEQLSPSPGPADRSAVIEGLQAGVLYKVQIITIGVQRESSPLVGYNITDRDQSNKDQSDDSLATSTSGANTKEMKQTSTISPGGSRSTTADQALDDRLDSIYAESVSPDPQDVLQRLAQICRKALKRLEYETGKAETPNRLQVISELTSLVIVNCPEIPQENALKNTALDVLQSITSKLDKVDMSDPLTVESVGGSLVESVDALLYEPEPDVDEHDGNLQSEDDSVSPEERAQNAKQEEEEKRAEKKVVVRKSRQVLDDLSNAITAPMRPGGPPVTIRRGGVTLRSQKLHGGKSGSQVVQTEEGGFLFPSQTALFPEHPPHNVTVKDFIITIPGNVGNKPATTTITFPAPGNQSSSYHLLNLNNTAEGFLVTITPLNTSVVYGVSGRYGGRPDDQNYDVCTETFVLPEECSLMESLSAGSDETDKSEATMFVKGKKDPVDYYVKVQVLGLETKCDISGQTDEKKLGTNDFYAYQIQWVRLSCVFWSETQEDWSTDGCTISDRSTITSTICHCNHLTAFGSDFATPPNTVDFGALTLRDLRDNGAVLTTIFVVYCLFLLVLVMVTIFDLKSKRKMSLGLYDYTDLFEAKPILGPIFFVTFMCLIFLVLMNIAVAIIDSALPDVRNHDMPEEDRYFIQGLWERFTALFGLQQEQPIGVNFEDRLHDSLVEVEIKVERLWLKRRWFGSLLLTDASRSSGTCQANRGSLSPENSSKEGLVEIVPQWYTYCTSCISGLYPRRKAWWRIVPQWYTYCTSCISGLYPVGRPAHPRDAGWYDPYPVASRCVIAHPRDAGWYDPYPVASRCVIAHPQDAGWYNPYLVARLCVIAHPRVAGALCAAFETADVQKRGSIDVQIVPKLVQDVLGSSLAPSEKDAIRLRAESKAKKGVLYFADFVEVMSETLQTTTQWGKLTTTLSGYVGIDTLQEQMRKKALKRGFEFHIMVVGGSGLGKSTLVNTLFKAQISRRSCTNESEGTIPKTVQIKSVSHVIEEKGVRLKLTVTDTPGFGDQINNENCWLPILEFINDQYEKYLSEEVNVSRKKHIPDTRVHVCLYFISPTGHSCRPLDLEFMKRLDKVVNIVPIIAKADTLTLEERYAFKKREKMPFAIVGSDREYQVNGKSVLGRKTKWGLIEVENKNHCEFALLRDMLIRTHMQDLKDVTDSIHYENFRRERLEMHSEFAGPTPPYHEMGESNL
uniref:Uncharacterized protein n=1 Tax=Branchiostoma floridae TaxID=7739 RepID=C3YF73_BRAFL|eukprot:XP_002605065.1 hypothetical protein BRAFLDRAFT_124137 [Branchiostoma floridae]